MTKHKLSAVQYLRGLAAMSVVLDHTNMMMAFPKYFGRNFGPFWLYGAVGVNLFFIISGFIISFTALKYRDDRFVPAMDRKTFGLKRFTRIVPIMWIAIILYFLGRVIGRDGHLDMSYVRAFFLLPWGVVEPSNIWTLRHEAIFYFLFAVSLLGARFRPWILIVWILSPLVYAALSLPMEPETTGMQIVRMITHPCNIEFGCGLIIGLVWYKWTNTRSISIKVPSGPLIFALFMVFWTCCYALDVKVDSVYATVISSMLGGPLIFLAVHLKCIEGPIERVLSYLGEASFSIYLFHLHLVSACLGFLSHHFGLAPSPVVLFVTASFAIAGAIVIYELVEKPVHRQSLKLLARRAPRPNSSPA